jgi:hypothetical protein
MGLGMFLPALASGGASLIASLIQGALSGDPYHVDPRPTRAASALSPDRDPFGTEAAQAGQRIANVNNPWLLGALANQTERRSDQQRYIDELTAQATGAQSFSAEEAARGQADQRGNLQTIANSTQDRFARGGARTGSLQEMARLSQNWLLPTRAAMAQERQGAQDMLTNVLMGQSQQDLQDQDVWRRQRALKNQQAIAEETAKYGHRAIAGEDQRTRTGEYVDWQAIKAATARK